MNLNFLKDTVRAVVQHPENDAIEQVGVPAVQ